MPLILAEGPLFQRGSHDVLGRTLDRLYEANLDHLYGDVVLKAHYICRHFALHPKNESDSTSLQSDQMA